jgi:hypothetical protein
MEIVSGLVTLANALLAAVVGARLLRLGARTGGPERWLGVYFLVAPLLGTLLAGIVYMSFADPEHALPDTWMRPVHALDLALANVGSLCVLLFTWLTFRPGERWARTLPFAGGLALAGSWLAFGLAEGFAVRVLNGPAYWLGFAVRIAAPLWMTVEAFRYRGLLRRRVALGLAEPLVANRFLLWGLWALCALAMGLSDPIARVWYWAITGTASVWHPEIGRPIVVVMMALTSGVGVVGAACLFLTFFPTAGYRRWVQRGAAAAGIS